MIVSAPFERSEAKAVSDFVAGLFSTAPPVLNCEPWQGQMNVVPDTSVMVQPSWVQTAVSTEKATSEILVARKLPEVVWTNAVPPTVASGEPAPTATDTVRFDTTPVTVGRLEVPAPLGGVGLAPPVGDAVLPPPLGEVGLPPPHPGSAAPTATNDIA